MHGGGRCVKRFIWRTIVSGFERISSSGEAGRAGGAAGRGVRGLTEEGLKLVKVGRMGEAFEVFREAAQLAVGEVGEGDALENVATAANLVGRGEEVLGLLAGYVGRKPGDTEGWFRLGTTQHFARRFVEAVGSYSVVLEREAGHVRGRYHRALARLAVGDWEGGFADYEGRFELLGAGRARMVTPRWRGDELARGTRLLVCAEQGFGDTIFGVHVARGLRERVPGVRLVAWVPGALVRWVRGCGVFDEVVEMGGNGGVPEHEVHVPVMSLAGILRVRPEVAASGVCPWQVKRASSAAERVGVCWVGKKGVDEGRHMELGQMLAALPVGPRYVSLVPGQGGEAGLEVHGLRDFADTAEVMMGLDRVVTVDTAVAHLAGVTGVPTDVLVKWLPDWRWEGMPWYGTVRVTRQAKFGDWSSGVHHGGTGDTEKHGEMLG